MLSFSTVGIPSLDVTPLRRTNIEAPAATGSVPAFTPILTIKLVRSTFWLTTKSPSKVVNVVRPAFILTLAFAFNPWAAIDVTVANPLVGLYEILLIGIDCPVRYADALSSGIDPIPVFVTPVIAVSLIAVKLLPPPTCISLIL